MPPLSPAAEPYPDLVAPVQLVELASGVDSMYLSGHAVLPDGLLARLDSGKGRARAAENTVPFRFGGIEFGMSPYGFGKYQYRLSHESGILGITPSLKLPPLRFQPKAEFLHGLGIESAVGAIRYLLESELGEHRLSVSRVDLFSDWQGWNPSVADQDSFVKRARHVGIDIEGEDWTGFTFGRRRSGGIGGRIYDKTAEIAKKGSIWWVDKWSDRYVPGQPVIRVEFEYHRRALAKEFGLDTPEQVLNNLDGLWGYATDNWLTHRVATGDATKSRRPLSEPSQAIQHPSLRGESIGLERATGRQTEAKLESILPVLRGCFTSVSAQWGVDGMVEGLDRFASYLHSWEAATGRSVDGEITVKRQRKDWGL